MSVETQAPSTNNEFNEIAGWERPRSSAELNFFINRHLALAALTVDE